ncbi:MAG: J domain-containing protein [Myxococcota bacterium]|nr:J domain-containing protein [Myxococcota bacterium]
MSKQTHKDPYAALGVSRDAEIESIKKAYRKLAQQYHPDRNPDDPAAEERFKQVSAAYAVLSDPERRKNFDEFGEIALDVSFDAEKARAASRGFGGGFPGGAPGGGFQDAGDLGSLFEDLFGGGRAGRRGPFPQPGPDLETRLSLSFSEAVLGCEKRVEVSRPDAEGRTHRETLQVRIPTGVEDGARIRLAGKGGEGSGGGPAGDLYARIQVQKHKAFKRDGRNLNLDVPISIAEAITGAEVDLATLDGRLNLKVPPGTDGGTRLRLRGKGVPAHGQRPAGDLYVTIRIRVPKKLDEAQRKVVEELFDEDAARWREDLGK